MAIRLFLLMDSYSGIGEAITNDDSIQIKPVLISAMISAIQSYVEEGLQQLTQYTQFILGNWRVIVLEAPELGKHHEFVVFQDIYDSLEYSRLKAKAVSRLIKPHVSFHRKLPSAIQKEANAIITFSQKFPLNILTEKDEFVLQQIKMLKENKIEVLDLLVADVDDGIVLDFIPGPDPYEKTPDQLFYDLLSSVKFEQELFLETEITRETKKKVAYEKLPKPLSEGYSITPIGRHTDFYLISYFIFHPRTRDLLRNTILEISHQIYGQIKTHLTPWPWETY
ncbi:MAG: hypothetical protein ACFFCQ_08085 [Promethearchaeota archaeon]